MWRWIHSSETGPPVITQWLRAFPRGRGPTLMFFPHPHPSSPHSQPFLPPWPPASGSRVLACVLSEMHPLPTLTLQSSFTPCLSPHETTAPNRCTPSSIIFFFCLRCPLSSFTVCLLPESLGILGNLSLPGPPFLVSGV